MKNSLHSRIGKALGLFLLLTLVVVFWGCGKIGIGDQSQYQTVNEPRADDEFEGDAQEREDWFIKQRAYPFEKIPDEARRKAWDSRPPDARADLFGSTQWRSIGPSPTTSAFPNNWGLTSGRINAVTASPTNSQIVLVGGATGGIWRSVNGGDTFVPTSDSQVDLAVGSISFSPSNSSIVYAGMGDKAQGYLGTGVLKSTDAGQTWARISNTSLPPVGRISQILVHPTNPNVVYVAQYAQLVGGTLFSSGFYYSTDGGVNWTRTMQGLPRDLVQHPTTANTIYLAMGRVDNSADATGGVFKSTDSGLTWTRVYSSPFASTSNIKIATTPANFNTVFVLVGDGTTSRVEFSVNEGSTWQNQGSGSGFDSGQFSYNCYLFVDRTDPNIWYVGTRDLWRSTNTGANYTNITNNFQLNGSYTPNSSKSHPDQHHFYQSPSNPNTIYLANDGGLWRSTDNGTTFSSLNASLSLTMFTSLDLHPSNAAISYGGTQDNGTQRRTGNAAWSEFSSGDGGQTVVDVLDPSIVFTTYINHSISRFNSNGTAFGGSIGNSTIFASDRVAFYPPFVGNGVNSSLYFGTYRLYISTNRGVSWTAPGGVTDLTNGGTLSAIGVAKSNTNTIYTGASDGRLMVSTDGGVNWTDRTAGLPTRFIKSIIVNPTNANTAYVTLSGYLSGHVYKTTNAGVAWTNISGNLPDIPTNTLMIDPNTPTTLYVGTDVGVFSSTTDGTTWATHNNGMPPTIVTELDSQANGLMQASTYGRGAYELDPSSVKTKFDFDGDSRTDISIFRPGPGQWWYLRSSDNGNRAFQFGVGSDKTVPADYTGDRKTDVAFFRPSTSEWFILRSEDSTYYAFQFGASGDVPAPGDFDGDGRADAAIYRPSEGNWYIANSSGGTTIRNFGIAEDIPMVQDYDGDGKDDIAVFRPTPSQWWISRSSDNSVRAFQFGSTGDKPVPADYTGDGKADVAIWRPSNGNWLILRSEDVTFYAFPFGSNGDIPAPGDYDGDGTTDATVFRPAGAIWYVLGSTSGLQTTPFGIAGDRPVPSSYIP